MVQGQSITDYRLRMQWTSCVDWDSTVRIATRYGLDGAGIESLWGQDFLHPFRAALGPTQPHTKGIPGLFPRVKATGAWL